MKIKIVLEVDATDLDWGKSIVYPTDNGVGGVLLDIDIDTVTYQGQPIEFVDDDKAADYLEFCYGESDQKDYAHA